MIFTFVAPMDRVGRRPPLLTGLVGTTIALAAPGPAYLLPPSFSGVTPRIALGRPIPYVVSFAVGFGVVPWVVPEIFPLRVRGSATGLSTTCQWSANSAPHRGHGENRRAPGI